MTQGYEPHPQEQLEVSLVFPGFVLGASLIDEVSTYASFFESVTDQILDEGFASGFELPNSIFCALTHQVVQKTQCLNALEGYYKSSISELYADGSTDQAHIRIRSHWYNDVETSHLIRAAFILDRNGRTGFNYTAANGRNVRMAINYAVTYALNPSAWPWPNNEPIDTPYGAYQFTAIPLAYHHYDSAGNYWSVIQMYPKTRDDFRVFGRAVVFLGADTGSTTPPPPTTPPPTTAPPPTTPPPAPDPVPAPLPTPSPSGNVVRNWGFEDGKSQWNFYTNGSGAFDATTPAYEGAKGAKINITTGGSNIQLYERDIVLEANTKYTLTFTAKSNSGHDLQVFVHRDSLPYTNYGLSEYRADLTTAWKTFTVEFTTKGFTTTVNNARLRFWLAPYASPGDEYNIDSVILAKSTAVVVVPPSAQNLVRNPGFDSQITPWYWYTNGAGTFTISGPAYEGDTAGKVVITREGTNVQVSQRNITLEPNTRYRLSFAAKSNTGHDAPVTIIKDTTPYTNYGLVSYTANLETNFKVFTVEFTTKNFTSTVSDARLMFYLPQKAKLNDVYYFDSVNLVKIN